MLWGHLFISSPLDVRIVVNQLLVLLTVTNIAILNGHGVSQDASAPKHKA